VDCHSDYTDQGTDQLEETRQQIANDPTNRRMLFTAWNPTDLSQMALPPCHLLGQWYVAHDDKLWLQVYQRSGDVFLGVPFNLFSYSVLVHMMAHLTKKKVGGLIHILGDAHIYENHLDVAKEQLQRSVHTPPRFRVKATCQADTWEDFALESFELVDYTCEEGLKASMVA
jgi:thymidylate synthase